MVLGTYKNTKLYFDWYIIYIGYNICMKNFETCL